MSKIMETWEEVLREAIAKDFDVQEMALFRIGLVLERHNNPNQDAPYLYETNLQRPLLRLVLDESRQRDTIQYLVTLARQQRPTLSTCLYALSCAQPPLLVQPLVDLLNEQGMGYDETAAYQAALAVERCLNAADDPAVAAAFRSVDLTPLLEHWSAAKDKSLAAKASRLKERIDEFGKA